MLIYENEISGLAPQVNAHTRPRALAEKLSKQFQDAYGIKIEVTDQTSALILQKYQLEWDSKYSYADVVIGSDVDVFGDMADRGMLKEIDLANGKKIIECALPGASSAPC